MPQRLNNKLTATGRGRDCRGIHPYYPGPVHANWREEAQRKGFEILGRITDRYTLDLRCNACGGDHASRISVLMSARPTCPHCLEDSWRSEARKAGLEYLYRDRDHRHYSWYKASCRHAIRRQHGFVGRIARGEAAHRCETCQQEREAYEARKRGWTRLGPDPDGNPNYRGYRHDACGARQRVARANIQSGRFECATCGDGWTASRSYLYAMSFRLRSGREVIKLGYSRDPDSRLMHQLRIDHEMPCRILARVEMATGHEAIRIEKRLHAHLRRVHPNALVPSSAYRDQIRVRSEIYDIRMRKVILAHLADIAEGRSPLAKAERRSDTGNFAAGPRPAGSHAFGACPSDDMRNLLGGSHGH